MNLGTAVNYRVVLDTNILISAIGFGGKPRKILLLTLGDNFQGVTSSILLAEFHEVIIKKFPELQKILPIVERKISKKFLIVKPRKTLDILKDKDDNRVLEAAIEGNCAFIVTGDKELLKLKNYQGIKVLTAEEFLSVRRYS
ncbi:putative toxin-antitoxin system toxin component, PIN family [Candidatus Microgenomates bacterium]|nr:putative toxin-antitoxin system toxin component, PIN family [Candidatus Microgenomates bacterium]